MRTRNRKPANTRSVSIKWLVLLCAVLVSVLALAVTKNPPVASAQGTSVVQFETFNYTVNEDVTFKRLTVVRTGNLATVGTVWYSTGNVGASQIDDFTFAIGILRFGVNESSKSIDVLINEDNKRETDETFTVTLSSPGGLLLGSTNPASITIIDDAIEAGPNPIDLPDVFVGTHYHDFLARQADDPGQVYWQNEIASCGNNVACLEDRRINVSAAFFLSIEFQQTGYLVIRAHKAAFGSAPQVPRYIPFIRDQRRVTEGVIVGNTGWEALLAANRQAYLEEFANKLDFNAEFPQGTPAGTYVDRLFANCGVVPTPSERTAAINAYGTGNNAGRAAALFSVIDSDSVYNQLYNPSFVLMQYFGYLRREADDPPDNNFGGYTFWLNKMNQFTLPGENVRDPQVALLRVKRAEMIKSFLVSIEYLRRFANI